MTALAVLQLGSLDRTPDMDVMSCSQRQMFVECRNAVNIARFVMRSVRK
jgi:hypothetical protein